MKLVKLGIIAAAISMMGAEVYACKYLKRGDLVSNQDCQHVLKKMFIEEGVQPDPVHVTDRAYIGVLFEALDLETTNAVVAVNGGMVTMMNDMMIMANFYFREPEFELSQQHDSVIGNSVIPVFTAPFMHDEVLSPYLCSKCGGSKAALNGKEYVYQFVGHRYAKPFYVIRQIGDYLVGAWAVVNEPYSDDYSSINWENFHVGIFELFETKKYTFPLAETPQASLAYARNTTNAEKNRKVHLKSFIVKTADKNIVKKELKKMLVDLSADKSDFLNLVRYELAKIK